MKKAGVDKETNGQPVGTLNLLGRGEEESEEGTDGLQREERRQ